jgi:hypothetical protein
VELPRSSELDATDWRYTILSIATIVLIPRYFEMDVSLAICFCVIRSGALGGIRTFS